MNDYVRQGDVLWTRGAEGERQLKLLVPMDILENLGEDLILTKGFNKSLRLYSLNTYIQDTLRLMKMDTSLGKHIIPAPIPVQSRHHWLSIPQPLMAFSNIEKRVFIYSDPRSYFVTLSGSPPKGEEYETDFIFVNDDLYFLPLPLEIYKNLRYKTDLKGNYNALLTISCDENRRTVLKLWDSRYAEIFDELQSEVETIMSGKHLKGAFKAELEDGGVWIPAFFLYVAGIDHKAILHYLSEGVYTVKAKELEDDDIDEYFDD